jgi:hypothetical protein
MEALCAHLVVRKSGNGAAFKETVVACYAEHLKALTHARVAEAQAQLVLRKEVAAGWPTDSVGVYDPFPLDPTIEVRDGYVSYEVLSVPLVLGALGPQGLFPWMSQGNPPQLIDTLLKQAA